MRLFEQLGPSLLRYPGGRSANWFDLSTGVHLANPTTPSNSGKLESIPTPSAWAFCAAAVRI